MHPTVQHPHSGFLRRPSSTLGWAAVIAWLASIVLIVFVNVLMEQGGDLPLWQMVLLAGGLLGLLAAFVMGAIAALRQHERSWLVIVPTALAGLVVANELVQGILQLFGLGGE